MLALGQGGDGTARAVCNYHAHDSDKTQSDTRSLLTRASTRVGFLSAFISNRLTLQSDKERGPSISAGHRDM
jgi:hypothetical protein